MVPDEVSLHCPHCGKHTAVTPALLSIIVASPNTPPNNIAERHISEWIKPTPYYVYGSGRWWLGKCNACQQPLLLRDHGSKVFPTPQPGPVSEDIPEPMRSDLREAKLCLSAGAWNAAAVMARRALQSAAVEQGAPKGKKLWEQIKWLDEDRKITQQQRRWADAARWVGNHGAHDTEPDVASGAPVITDVAQDDAEDTIKLVEHLFETLYVAGRAADHQLLKRGKLKP
jgi:HEPN domain-containing protein